MPPAPGGRPATPWLRELHDQLMADARAEALLYCKVAVLVTAGLSWVATAERLGVEHTDVQRAVRRVRTVSGRLEGQDRPQV